MKVLRVLDALGTIVQATPPPGTGVNVYVESFDPEAFDGRGRSTWTTDPAKAKRFPDMEAAMAFYRQSPASRPTRDDGKPNRPLTVFTVLIEDAP